jgi:hypothetical protein
MKKYKGNVILPMILERKRERIIVPKLLKEQQRSVYFSTTPSGRNKRSVYFSTTPSGRNKRSVYFLSTPSGRNKRSVYFLSTPSGRNKRSVIVSILLKMKIYKISLIATLKKRYTRRHLLVASIRNLQKIKINININN